MNNVKPGDRVQLSAQHVNLWSKTAEAYRAGKFQNLATTSRESDSPVVIMVQNKTDEFAGVFSVLALGESINLVGTDIAQAMPDGFNKSVAFEGQKPQGDGSETVCITLDAANPETLVSAVILGAVGCVVDITNTSHRYAVPVSDDVTKLQSSASGVIRILNPVTETGEQFCYVLLGGGGTAGEVTTPGKVRLVQPKELFPACEYKSLQNVHGCTLEYSDDGDEWTPAQFPENGGGLTDEIDISGRAVFTLDEFVLPLEPHKHWRVNLKGFSKPEDPNDPGFVTFGRMWEARFEVQRYIETTKTVTRRIEIDTLESTEYTFTAEVPDNWRLNQGDPVMVNLSMEPELQNGELFYKPSTSNEWQSLGAFTSQSSVMISADDLLITVDEETKQERHNKSFLFRVETLVENHEFETVAEYDPVSDTVNEVVIETVVNVVKEAGNLTLRRPTYKLSPDDADVAMPAPKEDFEDSFLYWDSKPLVRKSQDHRYWTLTFDQPELVTKIMLDLDQHLEHYIIAPGGRDEHKQVVPFIYSFDLAAEKWTATTFPSMRVPMFNMDAAITKQNDGLLLTILSGQTTENKYSSVIQGYNFDKDKVLDMGEPPNGGGMSFAGRPIIRNMTRVRDSNSWFGSPYDEDFTGKHFVSSLLIAGGGRRSTYFNAYVTSTAGGVSNTTAEYATFLLIDSLFQLFTPYRFSRQASGLSQTYPGWGVTTSVSLPSGVAKEVYSLVEKQHRFARDQAYPVRGFARQKPEVARTNSIYTNGYSHVSSDIMLLGGFCEKNFEALNTSVVTGLFTSAHSSVAGGGYFGAQLFTPAHGLSLPSGVNDFSNDTYFWTYPRSPYVLGDCCAEYVQRDDGIEEILCFGGRVKPEENVLPHSAIAVLRFNPESGGAEWLCDEYPPMPHPRWSAASVLIKDLVRTGETEPCSRIFIIGGRTQKGEFVPEVDVFNLVTNQWETDWKGLDEGELETIPALLTVGGGTIMIGSGGSSGVQSVKAGDGIKITGDNKNPVVSAPIGVWG